MTARHRGGLLLVLLPVALTALCVSFSAVEQEKPLSVPKQQKSVWAAGSYKSEPERMIKLRLT